MNDAKIVPYEPEHALSIFARNVEENILKKADYPDWDKWAIGWKECGVGFTLLVNDEIVGSAGIVFLDWRRGEVWMISTSLFYRHRKTAIRFIKQNLDRLISEHNLRRVQAIVKPDFEVGQRFVEHLGFVKEGLLKAYGPDGDYLMYGRIS